MRDPVATRQLVRDAVVDYDQRSVRGGLPFIEDVDSTTCAVWDGVVGFGPLQRYLDEPQVEEIWINQPSGLA
mgnify:FL=1